MSKITLVEIVKPLKIAPKAARSILRRRLGDKAPSGKWEFTPAQAKAAKKALTA